MGKRETEVDDEKGGTNMSNNSGATASGGAIYGLGIFGAWVYFWQQADGFWEYVLAVLQGLVWPAILVYEAFSALAI
jgi:predicted outer membrane repeat protein